MPNARFPTCHALNKFEHVGREEGVYSEVWTCTGVGTRAGALYREGWQGCGPVQGEGMGLGPVQGTPSLSEQNCRQAQLKTTFVDGL